MPQSDGPTAPKSVRLNAHDFFEGVGDLMGDRLGESRFDLDRGLRVTVIDLDDRDVTAITELAERLDISAWARVERAEPEHLVAWQRLRRDLRRLAVRERGVLMGYPDPETAYRRPPVSIDLAAHAESVAADLHGRYGDFVELQVGALPYPPTDAPAKGRGWLPDSDATPVDPDELLIVWESPLVISSGQTAHHAVLLTNLGDHTVTVNTNRNLTGTIVDDAGEPVGGFTGAQSMPLVMFTAEPGETVRIPMLVGTSSYSPELGYAVPAGTWHVVALLLLSDRRRLVTPPLELTITD